MAGRTAGSLAEVVQRVVVIIAVFTHGHALYFCPSVRCRIGGEEWGTIKCCSLPKWLLLPLRHDRRLLPVGNISLISNSPGERRLTNDSQRFCRTITCVWAGDAANRRGVTTLAVGLHLIVRG